MVGLDQPIEDMLCLSNAVKTTFLQARRTRKVGAAPGSGGGRGAAAAGGAVCVWMVHLTLAG